jgi:hypothetical protein
VGHYAADGAFHGKKYFPRSVNNNICEIIKDVYFYLLVIVIITTFYLHVLVLCFPRLSVSPYDD